MKTDKQEAITLNSTRFESSIKARSFSGRVINDWNALSNDVATAKKCKSIQITIGSFLDYRQGL